MSDRSKVNIWVVITLGIGLILSIFYNYESVATGIVGALAGFLVASRDDKEDKNGKV